MKRVKQRIFAGTTCDQIIMHVRDSDVGSRNPQPRERFESEEERENFNHGRGLRRFIRLINANFTPAGYYLTLTFDDEHEIYYFEDAKRIRDNLKRKIKRKFPDAVFVIVMGRGEATARIHFHMLFEGGDIEFVKNSWTYGKVIQCSHLRASNIDKETNQNVGTDYTRIAAYLWNHWTEEQGGKHYSAVRNMKQPEKEPAVECIRTYSPEMPPIPPKGYKYVKCTANTQFGYQCFHYVKIVDTGQKVKQQYPPGSRFNAGMDPCKCVQNHDQTRKGGKQ